MVDKMKIGNQAAALRNELGEDEFSPIDIFSLAQTIDALTIVAYPLGKNISGACFKGDSSSVVAINSDMSIGRQRFSLAHELYHLRYDENQKTTNICSSTIGSGAENEKCADQFASYFLMPPAALYKAVEDYKKKTKQSLSLREVIRLEQYFRVSHQVMLIRLQEDGELSASETASMQSGIISKAARLGFDVSLYKPSPEDKKTQVLGHYITQAEKLFGMETISNGKYEELLLSAFRDDIVFGYEDETEGGGIVD